MITKIACYVGLAYLMGKAGDAFMAYLRRTDRRFRL